jgi:hypothetical protein
MFCDNCGNPSVEGTRYCTACGGAQALSPASPTSGAPHYVGLEPPSQVTSEVDGLAGEPAAERGGGTTTLVKPDGGSRYCRHSPSERSTLGQEAHDGSEICGGCGLAYAPGSPGSGLPWVAAPRRAVVSPNDVGAGPRRQYAPPSHLALAIASVLFFWPLGIPAVVYAVQVLEKWGAGDFSGAKRSSSSAKSFAMLALMVGALVLIMYVFFMISAVQSASSLLAR